MNSGKTQAMPAPSSKRTGLSERSRCGAATSCTLLITSRPTGHVCGRFVRLHWSIQSWMHARHMLVCLQGSRATGWTTSPPQMGHSNCRLCAQGKAHTGVNTTVVYHHTTRRAKSKRTIRGRTRRTTRQKAADNASNSGSTLYRRTPTQCRLLPDTDQVRGVRCTAAAHVVGGDLEGLCNVSQRRPAGRGACGATQPQAQQQVQYGSIPRDAGVEQAGGGGAGGAAAVLAVAELQPVAQGHGVCAAGKVGAWLFTQDEEIPAGTAQ